MNTTSVDQFVDAWGAMGSAWGINASLARVHALLIASDEPTSLDQIAQRLSISRGNASMSLRDLRAWGVVRRVKLPRSRQDYYVTEPDVWKMAFAIMRERKRREFDPALELVRETVQEIAPASDSAVGERLRQIERLMTMLDNLARQLLRDESTARGLLSMLEGGPLAENE